MHDTWIISIGTELTLGRAIDTNAAWLAAQLAALGVRARRHVTVPDESAAIASAALQAAQSADLVLITGGLGPTDDDLTRQALAAAAGVELQLHPRSLDALRVFFANRRREMPERNTIQAMVPRAAVVLPNTCGTAPGFRIDIAGTPCYALPGVPFEMRLMFQREVAPRVRAGGGGAVLSSRVLHTFGWGESDVGQAITDLMQPGRNPEVGTTADGGIVGIRINATAPDSSAATSLLDAAEAEIRGRLGQIVFGRDDDTLAGVVGSLLLSAGVTVATAESCTGGLIGKLLTDVSGSSRYYAGGIITYSNEAKTALLGVARSTLAEHGAVSEPVAREMARGVTEAFGTDYGVSVTGIAGPTGGTAQKPVGLVFIGLHGPESTLVKERRFGSDPPREVIRLRAARTALNLLRLRLSEGGGGGATR